jgi:hypothetical protein
MSFEHLTEGDTGGFGLLATVWTELPSYSAAQFLQVVISNYFLCGKIRDLRTKYFNEIAKQNPSPNFSDILVHLPNKFSPTYASI